MAIFLLFPIFTFAASAATCPSLSRNLSFGSRGNDVTQLQQFLISQSFLATGNATDYFGRLTQAAVKKFQCQKGIVCNGSPSTNGYGAVGPRTRAAIAVACKTRSATPSALYNTNPYTPPTSAGPATPPQGAISPPVGTVNPNSPLIPQNPPLAPVQNVLTKPTITVLKPLFTTNLYFNDDTGAMNAEITPWTLESGRTGGWHTFLVTTARTFTCSIQNNIFAITGAEVRIADTQTCRKREGSALNASNAAQANALPMWKRDYYGAFSGHLLKTGANDYMLYMINHGEMNNDDPAMNPTSGLSSCVPAPDMGYGALPCTSQYWWGSYNAFIGMSSFPWTQAGLAGSESLTTDYGPITWPSNGYIETLDGGATWVKATDGGVRHPSSIVKDNYLYVFYEDLSQGTESDGRGPGIKVIRAPITSGGVDPMSFHAYFNGGFADAALPGGYSISNYYTKWSVKGGRASNLFPRAMFTAPPTPGTKRTDQRRLSDIFSFSVAKVNGTDWYLGVANEQSKGLTLRLSKDLVTWSEPTIVPGTESYYLLGVDLQHAPLLYARLANADGDSNTDIDPNDFYIIGTQTAPHGTTEAKVVNAIHLKLGL